MALDNWLRDELERWLSTSGEAESGIVRDLLLSVVRLDDAVRKLEAFVLMPEQREGR